MVLPSIGRSGGDYTEMEGVTLVENQCYQGMIPVTVQLSVAVSPAGG